MSWICMKSVTHCLFHSYTVDARRADTKQT